MTKPLFVLLFAWAAMASPAGAPEGDAVPPAGRWRIDPEADNRAAFRARTVWGSFTGTTSRIDGHAAWEGLDGLSGAPEGSEFRFEVALDLLDTGIKRRDRHMREKYLETERYPTALYRGRIVRFAVGEKGAIEAAVEGTFALHGEERPLAVTGRVIGVGEGRYRLACAFPLDLREFGIKPPSLLGFKVSPAIEVEVEVALREGPPPPAGAP